MSFDFTKKEPKQRPVDMWEFTPAQSGLKSAPHQLRSGMKDPMRFTDVCRKVAPGKFKPKQVFCYSCGREFGTRSLKIHWRSCVEKRRVEMNRRPRHEEASRVLQMRRCFLFQHFQAVMMCSEIQHGSVTYIWKSIRCIHLLEM